MKLKLCTVAQLDDLENIAKLAYNDHYLYLWNDGGVEYVDKNFDAAVLEKELKDENALFYLIFNEDQLVGFLKLNKHQALENYTAKEALELERIYLTKAATGLGLGTQIVEFVIQIAKKMDKKLIWLKAMESSRSVSFYQQQGFKIVSSNYLNYPPMKEEYRTILVMKKMLS
jgi:GNAT superfamily N-acetyltransferase